MINILVYMLCSFSVQKIVYGLQLLLFCHANGMGNSRVCKKSYFWLMYGKQVMTMYKYHSMFGEGMNNIFADAISHIDWNPLEHVKDMIHDSYEITCAEKRHTPFVYQTKIICILCCINECYYMAMSEIFLHEMTKDNILVPLGFQFVKKWLVDPVTEEWFSNLTSKYTQFIVDDVDLVMRKNHVQHLNLYHYI